MENRPIPILVVAGPTATGKSALAVRLAQLLDGEIINADSMQIYDRLQIGTARPGPQEMGEIPHHLFGFVPVEVPYSVGRYLPDAASCIRQIAEKGHCPILCGGTGLYLTSLLENRQFLDQPEGDRTERERLWQAYETLGEDEMYRRLVELDPKAAANIHKSNHKRVVRALEIYETTGRTLTQQNEISHQKASPYLPLRFALDFHDRSVLWNRIEKRVDMMLENGILEEARWLLEHAPDSTAAQAIGYKELFGYLKGEASLAAARESLVIATRQYAKRQRTWFAKEPYTWLYPDEWENSDAFLQNACKTVEEAWQNVL